MHDLKYFKSCAFLSTLFFFGSLKSDRILIHLIIITDIYYKTSLKSQ